MRELNIETPRLYLRLMHSSDLDALQEIFGDSKVMDSFDAPPFTREQMEQWIARNIDHQVRYGYGLFSVIEKSERVLIGDCGLEHMELEGERVTELGYDIRSDYWNQGYATEAASAVRDFAFTELHIPALISLIRVGNEASKRISEKIGMRFIGEITQSGVLYWKYAITNKSAKFCDQNIMSL